MSSETPKLSIRDHIEQLRLRRAAIAARFESLQASLEEARQTLREVDEILLTLEDANQVHVYAVGVAATASVGTPAVSVQRASGNPKKEVIAKEVHAYLRTSGKPLSRKELFEKLSENGYQIRGANPEMVLSTMLWRAGEENGIERLSSGGYALKAWRTDTGSQEDMLGGLDHKDPNVFD